MTDDAICLKNISKCYHIYDKPRDRLKQLVMPRLQRIVGDTPKQYYREFWALRDVSFEIKRGETVGIIGRNGSGKSTLLQLICGTLNPTGGSVQTNGRIAALLELGSGFNPEFTGRENVYMNAAILGLRKNEIDARFGAIQTFAGIGEFIDQPLKKYSSGMMMRLAFAVIAHVDADILVVDEALSVGDSVFVQQCNLFLRRFRKNGTLLFVSHSMQSVLELCDRAIWLKDGEMQADGVAKQVTQKYHAHIHQQVNGTRQIQVKERAERCDGSLVSEDEYFQGHIDVKPTVEFSASVFAFDFTSSYWGAGGAKVVNMEVLNSGGERIVALVDCGFVTIRVHCTALQCLQHPIVGFTLRNYRGVEIMSENTDLGYMSGGPPTIQPGQEFYADFTLFIPYLPTGEYFLGGAIAERPDGNEAHVQHHRQDDAVKISITASHVVYGLVSMPMQSCSITIKQ